MWARLSLLALCGCAQLAGLDETSGDGRTPVSLAFERVSIGVTVETAPLELAGHTATYLVPDGEGNVDRVTAAQAAMDTWSAELFAPTPVVFDLPELAPIPRMFDYPQKTLRAGFVQLERPGAMPVAPDSLLAVEVTLDAPYVDEALQLFTVGSWNARDLGAPLAGATTHSVPAFEMQSMTSLSGRPHELITAADAVFVLRHAGGTLTGVGEVPPFDQTGNDTLTAAVTTITRELTLDLQIDPAAAAQRLSAARPAVPAVTFSWAVHAAPGHELAVDTGPQLAGATAVPGDTVVQATYGNPFEARGWSSVLTWSARATRSYTPPGQAAAVTLVAGMFQRELDPAAGLALDLPAGLPELIRLDGESLSVDGATTIKQPIRPVEITFEADRDGATLHELELIEIAPSPDGMSLVRTRRFAASALEPRFLLLPELLEPGKMYTVRAISIVGGYPEVANGDLRTRSLPIAAAFLESGVFQVEP